MPDSHAVAPSASSATAGGLIKVAQHIRKNFRVRQDTFPQYVDLRDNLSSIGRNQHQVVFGRRGTGKSTLLLNHLERARRTSNLHATYLNADLLKRADYPDIIARILLTIFEDLPLTSRKKNRLLGLLLAELRDIINREDTQSVVDQRTVEVGGGASINLGGPVGLHSDAKSSAARTTSFTSDKVTVLERRLPDYAAELARALASTELSSAHLILDDFYLLDLRVQPDVIDYLHRLSRGTSFYVKLGTVRHRTILERAGNIFVGVELGQDIEQIDLDSTLEDLAACSSTLKQIIDKLAAAVDVRSFCDTYLGANVLALSALASGGVPRDFLNIIADAIEAREPTDTRPLSVQEIFSATADFWYRVKLPALYEDVPDPDANDLEALFTDLRTFCIQQVGTPVFAVRRSDLIGSKRIAVLLAELTDLKFVHLLNRRCNVAESDTEVALYLLDLSAFGSLEVQRPQAAPAPAPNYQDLNAPVASEPLLIQVYSLSRAELALSSSAQVPPLPLGSDATEVVTVEISGETSRSNTGASDLEVSVAPAMYRRPPKSKASLTTTFSVGGAEGQFTVALYEDGSPCDVLIELGKQGSTLAGVMDAFSLMISIALQHQVPLVTMVQQFTNMRFEPAGMTDDPDVRMAQSICDYVFRRVALDHLPFTVRSELGIHTAAERARQLETGVYEPTPPSSDTN